MSILNLSFVYGKNIKVITSCSIESNIIGYNYGDDEAFFNSLVSKAFGEKLAPIARVNPIKGIPLEYITPKNQKYFKDLNRTEFLNETAAFATMNMIDEAKKNKINLFIHSAYRSYDQQCSTFLSKVKIEMKKAPITIKQAIDQVNLRSAFPGESEHQLATTVDLVSDEVISYLSLEYSFSKTLAYQWLQLNAYKFGFVMSYPAHDINNPAKPHPETQIVFEPWHWRYVGSNVAERYLKCSAEMPLQEFLRRVNQKSDYNCKERLN